MSAKIPEDAFAMYVALGPERSYQTVADHCRVTKRAVVKLASREGWAERLAAIEKKTREMTDAKLATDLHEMDLRHRQMLRAMAGRAARAIAELPLTSGMEGIRAAEAVIKLERLLAGEATERTVNVEAIIRDEQRRLLVPISDDAPEDPSAPEEPDEDLVEEGGDIEIEDDEGDIDAAASG